MAPEYISYRNAQGEVIVAGRIETPEDYCDLVTQLQEAGDDGRIVGKDFELVNSDLHEHGRAFYERFVN